MLPHQRSTSTTKSDQTLKFKFSPTFPTNWYSLDASEVPWNGSFLAFFWGGSSRWSAMMLICVAALNESFSRNCLPSAGTVRPCPRHWFFFTGKFLFFLGLTQERTQKRGKVWRICRESSHEVSVLFTFFLCFAQVLESPLVEIHNHTQKLSVFPNEFSLLYPRHRSLSDDGVPESLNSLHFHLDC